jgi:excisionase family DNA binding protein
VVDPPIALAEDEALRVYTIAEAARLLRVPEGWLRKKVTAGLVPHTRLGKHVRFTDEHLRRIVADGEQEPARPAEAVGQGLSSRARRVHR